MTSPDCADRYLHLFKENRMKRAQQAWHLPCFATLNTKPDLYFASVKCMNGVRGQTISTWSWLSLIILAVHSILFVLIFWNMSGPDSKLCQVPRKSRRGPAELLQLEDGGGGPFQENNLPPALSDGGVTRRIGTYIKRTAKQLSVFY